MPKIYACLAAPTPSAAPNATLDAALWAAQRLDAPLALLHVLERHTAPSAAPDLSGAIGLGAQEALLDALSQRDEQHGRAAQQAARALLADAARRAAARGLAPADQRLRHGELADELAELTPDARLFVLGRAQPAEAQGAHPPHLERVVRAAQRPVLIAPGERFQAPARALIAFDGGRGAAQLVDHAAASPLLAGLALELVMAGPATDDARAALHGARQTLAAAGRAATVHLQAGPPAEVLAQALRGAPGAATDAHPPLLVMGAYSHSRLRQALLGSTTTALLRSSPGPMLVVR